MSKLKKIFLKIKKNPLDFLRRVIFKLVVGPLKYKKQGGYDAFRFWTDRLSKYPLKLTYRYDESLSEEENINLRINESQKIVRLCRERGINFSKARVLDVGCANGFYTQILFNLGVKNYVGTDITSILFPRLRNKFPHYKFIKNDISIQKITGKYELILLISVIQHIVEEDKLSFCLENIKECLAKNGIIMISWIMKNKKKFLPFYIHAWTPKDIKKHFLNYFIESFPLNDNYLLIIRRK